MSLQGARLWLVRLLVWGNKDQKQAMPYVISHKKSPHIFLQTDGNTSLNKYQSYSFPERLKIKKSKNKNFLKTWFYYRSKLGYSCCTCLSVGITGIEHHIQSQEYFLICFYFMHFVCISMPRDQNKVLDSLELEILLVIMWVLGTKPGSSAKVASAYSPLNHLCSNKK